MPYGLVTFTFSHLADALIQILNAIGIIVNCVRFKSSNNSLLCSFFHSLTDKTTSRVPALKEPRPSEVVWMNMKE